MITRRTALVLVVLGVLAVSAGAGLAYLPAGFIAFGLQVLALALVVLDVRAPEAKQ